ncbi:hypothetical protein AGMMS49938_17590 [Fibrobacterales bacterium]|nr:hypothetical protein AGMMS49938_17590 [Fibrobacterales bacterium]
MVAQISQTVIRQPQTAAQAPPRLESPYEQELKENPIFADFVKRFNLKFMYQRQRIDNGYAKNDSGNAENAVPDEEDSRELAESEL